MKDTDFIISHFEGQHELFPRTIMTSKSGGKVVIEYESNVELSKDKVFNFFKKANFMDCRINAFPHNTEYTIVDFEVKNKTAATFIMIDLDLKDFTNSREKLDLQLKKTINKLSTQFEGKAKPTILWTGNGYHIYQPLDGIVFEQFDVFYNFLHYLDGRDLTTEFMRFAEKYFTNNRADWQHWPSIKSCLIRIPGTINSKNSEEVRIVQIWNGVRPPIQLITTEFMRYLIQKRIDKILEIEKEQKLRAKFGGSHFNKNTTHAITWIERLLQIPIEDYRKTCMWRILCPYLINIRKISKEEATIIIKDWLEKCDKVRKSDFNPQREVSAKLKSVGPYFPSSKEKLKKELPELYNLLIKYNVIQKA